MSDNLHIKRGDHSLWVKPRVGGGFDLSATGGGNITEAEYAQIEAYAGHKAGGDKFLADVRRRMSR